MDDSETDTESTTSTIDLDDMYQDIDVDNQDIGEMTNGAYRIGLATYIPQEQIWLAIAAILPQPFYKYPHKYVCDYLYEYGHVYIQMKYRQLHIMKIVERPDTTRTVLLKTYWLRLVQRHWRKRYKERYHMILQRYYPTELMRSQIHGPSRKPLPGIRGMLSVYIPLLRQ
jgi:hypothetical protein